LLKNDLLSKLNEQINLEAYSSNLYLSMSSWCKANGYNGAGTFLYEHSKEELGHMRKLFNYINETGSMALIQEIKAPENSFESLKDVFQKTFEHEQYITQKINELVDFALETKDYSTFNFLQWYVSEQHEEEALFKGILDKIELVATSQDRGIFMLDQEISKMLKNNF
jgi:ferritin